MTTIESTRLNERCPSCNAEMYVFEYWWQKIVPDSNDSEFEFTCPSCEELLKVEVEQTPHFVVGIADEA